MTRRPAAHLAALACAGVLVLTGCSSSGSDGNTNVDVTTVPVQPGDLPAAWTAKAHDTSSDGSHSAANKQAKDCVGVRDNTGNRITRVYSKDYSKGDHTITSSASEYKSSSDVDNDAKLFSNPKTQQCFKKIFEQEITSGLPTYAKVDNSKIKIISGSNGGPSNVIATGTANLTITVKGDTITSRSTAVYIRGDRIEAEIDFADVGAASTEKPVDQATITRAVAAVAKRAAG